MGLSRLVILLGVHVIQKWRKKKILRAYLVDLPRDLADRYGVREFYSVGQIERTLVDLKYSSGFKDYAMAIFLTNDDALSFLGSQQLVEKIIAEIAELLFNGDSHFNVQLQRQRAIGSTGYCSIGAGPSEVSD